MRDPGGDLEKAADADLYYTLDVACLAHIEVQWYLHDFKAMPPAFDASIETHLRPVVAEENEYLGGFEEHSELNHVLLIGPTDAVDIRTVVIRELERQRRQAA
jgi:hypothetical protein